jgi:hypothetical protein
MTGNIVYENRIVKKLLLSDFFLSFFLCTLIGVAFIMLNSVLLHWCLIPLYLSGIMMGAEAVRWVRGRVDTLDPKGLIGAYGFHFFFLAPLIFLCFDMQAGFVNEPRDWRIWIGYIGWINLLSLFMFEVFQSVGFSLWPMQAKTHWKMKERLSIVFITLAILICFLAWVIFLVRMGGISGIIHARLAAADSSGTGVMEGVSGTGILRILMRSLTLLIVVMVTICRRKFKKKSLIVVGTIMVVFFSMQLIIGGLSGHRFIVVYPFIVLLGIVHYFWRYISPKLLILILVFLIIFSYAYGIYKYSGKSFMDLVHGKKTFSEVSKNSGNSLLSVLVKDLSRTDIQGWMIYKYFNFYNGYELRLGKTYLFSPFVLYPSWLPPKGNIMQRVKVEAGTEYIFGKNFYAADKRYRKSSRVYGLAGEALLNFGIWSIPFVFCIYGLAVGFYRRRFMAWPSKDMRLFLHPMVLFAIISALLMDLDNNVTQFIACGLITWVCICLISKKVISSQ